MAHGAFGWQAHISIHALLAESDHVNASDFHLLGISIHALLAESDPLAKVRHCEGYIFLSTLSLRRATNSMTHMLRCFVYFYPRSPCGERRRNSQNIERRHKISIHALLAESDISMALLLLRILNFYPRSPCGERHKPIIVRIRRKLFLSTLSLRRATWNSLPATTPHWQISIHALLAESDVSDSLPALRPKISIHALLAESDFSSGSGFCRP